MLSAKKDTSLQDKAQKSYKAELEAAALWLVVGAEGPGTLRTSPVLTCREGTSKGREMQESLFRACYEQEGNLPHASQNPLPLHVHPQ